MNEQPMKFDELIVAACFERHAKRLHNRSWIELLAEWGGKGPPTPDMLAVTESIKRELVQYIDVIPDDKSVLQ